MSDPSQPTALVTGASAGVGAAAALMLAQRGFQVVATGRTPGKLDAVAGRIAAATGAAPRCLPADFARLADVRRLARFVRERHPTLAVLALNAGLVCGRPRTATEDGHELTLQVNHLAPYLLTRLLWDRLGSGTRVVVTASAAHRGGLLDPAGPDFLRRRWSPWRAYVASKQANIAFTLELARRLEPAGAVATCFHPGVVRSDFGQAIPGYSLVRWLPAFVTPERGAGRLVHLATTADGLRHPGGYFVRSRLARPDRFARDPALASALWQASARLLGLRPDPGPDDQGEPGEQEQQPR